MQADWTLPNEDIRLYLERHDRYGIPFNSVHGPGAPQGLVLRELLTQERVIKAISAAKSR